MAIPVGFVFLILGVFGFFAGSSAHFTLPPLLGGVPFLLGWAMSITLIRFWMRTNRGWNQIPDDEEFEEAFE